MYDLILFPMNMKQGKPQPNGPGFLAVSPPRRAARSRSEDLLIVSFFTKGGVDRLSPALLDSWLANLVHDFYNTGGSVTSAMRSLIETLNLAMMEKNLKSAQEGAAVIGAINLAAIHRRSVYIVQSGLTHAYSLSQAGLAHFYDTSQTDRGLGLSRAANIRYYQADLGEGAYLFMTDNPPATWTETQLKFGGFPKLEQLRRRLLNQASPNIRLDLVQIVPGESQIKTVQESRPVPEMIDRDETVLPGSSATRLAIEIDETEKEPGLVDFSDTQEVTPETAAVEPLDLEDEGPGISSAEPPAGGEMPEARSAEDEKPLTPEEDELEPDAVKEVQDRPEKRKGKASPELRQTWSEKAEILRKSGLRELAIFFDWWRKFRGDVGAFFTNLLTRLGLIADEGLAEVSNRTLFLIAAAVPLVVVAIAVGVYLGRGRTLQYQYYQEQAELAAMRAYAAEESDLARDAWMETMLFIDQAESFRRTDETAQLRAEAQRSIDSLDGAVRLAYHPAIIGTLRDEINITRIISYGLDLYLLDSTGGQVIHAIRASQGYQLDAAFMCGAGNFSGGAVDALVDMVPLPINNPYQAHILAGDALGNVIYCGPGQQPVVQSLPRGEVMVGTVTRLASDGNLLYVLDPSAEAVRVYRSTNGQFLDAPSDFFAGAAEGQRPSITSMVDLAVNGAELYLLRADGMVAHCVASGLPGNPVTCENPVNFVDGRPGKEDQTVVMPGSRFVSVLFTAPPEPAVNILDGENADIFRFSLRFRLHQRLRSDFGNYEIANPTATAFTIGVDRIAFMAFGHQVFFAYVE